MDSLLNTIQEFKKEVEKDNKKIIILDVSYYGEINLPNNIDKTKVIKEDLFLVKKEIDGKIEEEFCTKNSTLAKVNENGEIVISEKYKGLIDENHLLSKLKDILPMSLSKLEQIEKKRELAKAGKTTLKEKYENKKDNEEENRENKEENESITGKKKLYEPNSKDLEIDLKQKVTEANTIEDLLPEAKGLDKLITRRKNDGQFEIIGVNGQGEEVELKSLQQTEGTNPNKDIIDIDRKGKAQKEQARTILKIKNGENYGKQNEILSISLGDYGIPEVNYGVRAQETNEYITIPVAVKRSNTNEKRADKDVIEFAEKRRNTNVKEDITRAEDRIEQNENNEVELENFDDNLYNDKIVDESEILIRKGAKRAHEEVDVFKKRLEKIQGDNLEEKIDNAVEQAEDEFTHTSRNRA